MDRIGILFLTIILQSGSIKLRKPVLNCGELKLTTKISKEISIISKELSR